MLRARPVGITWRRIALAILAAAVTLASCSSDASDDRSDPPSTADTSSATTTSVLTADDVSPAGEEIYGDDLPDGSVVGNIVSLRDGGGAIEFDLMIEVPEGPARDRAIELGLIDAGYRDDASYVLNVSKKVRTLELSRTLEVTDFQGDDSQAQTVPADELDRVVASVHAKGRVFRITLRHGLVVAIAERYSA